MDNKAYHIYEWDWQSVEPGVNFDSLKEYLSSVWNTRTLMEYGEEANDDEFESDIKKFKQGFLRFDGTSIGAKNYVGFIQHEGLQLNIYPKVFRNDLKSPEGNEDVIMRNVLYWLQYVSGIKFPFSEITYTSQRFSSFLEPFIFIFADVTNKQLEQQPFQHFEEVTEQSAFLKGRLAVNEYISRSVVHGNFHKLHSTFDRFEYNNKFNQIVKYVTRLLLSFTTNAHSIKRLQNILFLLDEVDDKYCTSSDCDRITFNRMYAGWESILNMCRMFLAGDTVKNQDSSRPSYSFLVPMEVIFEQFIAGFLKRHFQPGYKVESQKSDLYLVNHPVEVFNLQHDILVSKQSAKLIIDTKYKMRDAADMKDKKAGVQQSDMYQMVSYCFRRACNNAALVYPTNLQETRSDLQFVVTPGTNDNNSINVHVIELPFWSIADGSSIKIHLEDKLRSVLKKLLEASSQTKTL